MNIFIFAHEDDEFAVLPVIAFEIASGEKVLVVYCTSNPDPQTERLRQRESRTVLTKIGLPSTNIRFLGAELGVLDGECYKHLLQLYTAIAEILAPYVEYELKIKVPAWEGGHHDHDAVHALGLGVRLGGDQQSLRVQQFPVYTAARHPPGFCVMRPLRENGPAMLFRFSLATGLRMLSLMHCYRSQWRTFVALAPAIAWRYLVLRSIALQDVRIDRLKSRPHHETLHYERRYGVVYSDISQAVTKFLDALEVTDSRRPS